MVRILLVDDDNLLRKAIGIFLSMEDDFEVHTAENSTGALELLASESYDVVLSDNDMDYRNEGCNFMTQLKEQYPDVVRVLGSGREVYRKNCPDAHHILLKPYDLDWLIDSLRNRFIE